MKTFVWEEDRTRPPDYGYGVINLIYDLLNDRLNKILLLLVQSYKRRTLILISYRIGPTNRHEVLQLPVT